MTATYPEMRYVKLDPEVPDLGYARQGDAGIDLYSMEDVEIAPQGMVMVGSGVALEIPPGFYGQLVPRSGMATKRGITLINTPGTIDESYRGEVMMALYNMSTEMQCVNRMERCAQVIIQAYAQVTPIEVDSLTETERGSRGFGSSGYKERL